MATTISISKSLEAELRNAGSSPIEKVVALIDKAQARAPAGLHVKAFLDTLAEYRQVVLPQHAAKDSVYARLQKQLRVQGWSLQDAHALGNWLKAQTWLHDVTVEQLTRSMGEWLSRAKAKQPEFKRSIWDDGPHSA